MSSSFASSRRQNGPAVLFAVCLAALALPISFTGGALAAHSIGVEFSASAAQLNWITNGFMLTFGSFLLPSGALADVYGRKRVFLAGVILFAIASLALNFAPGIIMLNVLRALQGAGAAAALAGGSATLAQEFTGHAQTRAFSMIGTTFGIGLALGPLLSGNLIEHFGWRSIFLTGTILDVIALTIALAVMKETRNPNSTRFDWPGALAFIAALGFLTVGLNEAPVRGWADPAVLGAFAVSAGALAVFAFIETHINHPLLELSLFRYGRFVGVQILPISTCYAYVVLLILLPLRFVGVEGYSEMDAGLLMLALSAPMLAVPAVAAILARTIPAGRLASGGLIIAAAGLFWLSRIGSGGPMSGLIGPLLLIGTGAGFPWGLMDGLSITVVPRDKSGMASGIFNTTKVASEGITLAMVNALLASLTLFAVRQNVGQEGVSRNVGEAARQLAAGNLDKATSMLAPMGRPVLTGAYDSAFSMLLYVLAVVTLVAAGAVLVLLSPKEASTGKNCTLSE
ncbi:MFS transporter [Sodalis sp. dw_96]|uniref:MFS transporter n=1 Tax=Sodalis sp. dw_96 TaxID=2719794 RepID=UPI001BD25961|nr:MFS transporter [Sodalis sp. dw_96]